MAVARAAVDASACSTTSLIEHYTSQHTVPHDDTNRDKLRGADGMR